MTFYSRKYRSKRAEIWENIKNRYRLTYSDKILHDDQTK